MSWNTGGRLTNVAANAVLATMPAAPATGLQLSQCHFIISATVAGFFSIQHMPKTGSTPLHEQAIACAANGTQEADIPVGMMLADGEFFRVIAITANTGTVQASIFAE